MNDYSTISAGILLNSAVSAIVAIAASILVIFLLRRRERLGLTMRAYTSFWALTVLTWLGISARYFLISNHSVSPWIHGLDVAVQSLIFLSGAPLFYYLGLRVVGSRIWARNMALGSLLLGAAAFWFMLQPNGLIPQEVTYFSADTVLNPTSLIIFSAQIAIIFALLFVDLLQQSRAYRSGQITTFYEALYPLPIIAYLFLGTIEQSGFISNGTLVVFRVLYVGAFLAVYILMTLHENATETFLFDQTKSAALLSSR